MKSIKKILVNRLKWLAVLLMALILPLAVFLQIQALQSQADESAYSAFQQIRQILEENTRELETVKAEYKESCLNNAESIAYMIQYNPEILGDLEESRMIAQMVEVDEIHVFDKTGRIFAGTHPEYYGFTFETGEQIGFFAPLLENKSLRLCQDITPNTAEGKLVQYSALWSADRQFIVQVGMYPETVLEYTKKNELSYIFSLLQGSAGVDLYAIDAQTGTIQGATSGGDNGKNIAQIGLNMDAVQRYDKGRHMLVDGVNSYCVFFDMNGVIIGYVIANDTLYSSILHYTILMSVCLVLIVIVIVVLAWQVTSHYIINSIGQVNETLGAVADGYLDQRVEVRRTLEFSELSDHINNMIRSILSTTDKISFVLNQTNMRVGVYEYSTKMKTVRFTEHIPEILEWDERTREQISSDYQLLQKHLEKIQQSPVPNEKNIFRLGSAREAYVKLEEMVKGADTLGIIIDVTDEVLTRRRIEWERDIDLLTGVYNRRGMERHLKSVFYQGIVHGALVMIDADSLKYINDVYGHSVGDRYLQKIADAISSVGKARHITARIGGDEFVLLLYGYESDEAVMEDLQEIRCVQKSVDLLLENGERIPVRFSFGYVLTEGQTDYSRMITEADERMYAVKAKRKHAMGEANA